VRALEARDLACSRGGTALFRDVTFGVTAGEWLALRGANGSGKTTLLRCVAGLTRADAGEVFWDGLGVAAGAFRAELVYAGHAAGIKDDLSAAENLRDTLALRAAPAEESAMREALVQVGLDKRRHLPARRLSAGQRRRIGLARLALDPAPLWLLDEPLTALDDDAQRIFTGLLQRHLGRGGLAVIATHHDVSPPPSRELRLGA
jgi:heme exporter protein A